MVDIKKVIELVQKRGGIIDKTPYHLNLVGVRDTTQINTFNDKLIYFYYDNKGNAIVAEINQFTTDPGLKSLQQPVNPKGCSILTEGWHPALWRKGLHKGKYDAFVQNAPVKVYRDKNRDAKYDMNPTTIENGVFGINLHRANDVRTSAVVDGWSAGCQVVANPIDFKKLLTVRDLAIKAGQTTFGYTLLLKSDFA